MDAFVKGDFALLDQREPKLVLVLRPIHGYEQTCVREIGPLGGLILQPYAVPTEKLLPPMNCTPDIEQRMNLCRVRYFVDGKLSDAKMAPRPAIRPRTDASKAWYLDKRFRNDGPL